MNTLIIQREITSARKTIALVRKAGFARKGDFVKSLCAHVVRLRKARNRLS